MPHQRNVRNFYLYHAAMLRRHVRDIATLAGLLLIASAILAGLAVAAPTRAQFIAAEQSDPVTLHNFGELRQEGTLTTRRVLSGATLTFAANGPARYRMTLALAADAATVETVTIAVNGVAVGTVRPEPTMRDYTFEYTLLPAAWDLDMRDTLTIGFLDASGPASSGQPGGIWLSRAEVGPYSPWAMLRPELFVPNLLILLVSYLAIRAIRGVGHVQRVLFLSLPFPLLALGSWFLPSATLLAAYQPGLHPLRALGILGLIALVPLGAAGARRAERRAAQTPQRASRRQIAHDLALIFIVALGFRLLWVVLVPPWLAPDEGSHFAYVAHIVENGEIPHPPPYEQIYPTFSPEFGQSWTNTLYSRISTVGGGSVPDLVHFPIAYDYESVREYKAAPPDRYNQAGGTATPYPPLYYLIAAIPYQLAWDAPILSRLFASRSASALLGALSCIFGYLMAYELRRDRRWGMALGLSMALLPMYSFISASVNNDVAMVLSSTILAWLVVRVLRQPTISPRLAAAIGIVSGSLLAIKPTAAALLAVAGSVLFWRVFPRSRLSLRSIWSGARPLILAGSGLAGIYCLLPLYRLATLGAAGSTGSVEGLASAALVQGSRYSFLSYIEFQQRAGLTYFFWLFIKTFWGVFGWLELYMPEDTYILIALFYGIGIVGLCAQFAFHAQTRSQLTLLCGLIFAQLVFMFLIVDYFTSFAHSGSGLGLQGRYFFPVLAPALFVLFSGWSYLCGEHRLFLRLVPLGMLILQLISLATIVAKYYGVIIG